MSFATNLYLNSNLQWIANLTINVHLKNGNEGQKKSWYKTANYRKQFGAMLQRHQMTRPEPFLFPVGIVVTRLLGPGQKLWDPDSILRGNAKQLIDAIKAANWIKDDSAKHVLFCLGDQDKHRNIDQPGVAVDFYKMPVDE